MDNSPPAFPASIATSPQGDVYSSGQIFPGGDGMSIRDYFAGQAIVGYMAVKSTGPVDVFHAARTVYEIADAMLRVRGEA